jgi:membrane protein insertase Oxa1/YidC/SpoIIIJ
VKKIVEYVQSVVTITLLLAGIGGFFYNVFKKDGWGGAVLGKIWDANVNNPVVAIPVTIGIVFILKMWYDHNRAKGHTSKLPDVLIYVIMAAGVYFIWKFFTETPLP